MSATRRRGAHGTARRVLGVLAAGALGLAPLLVPGGGAAPAAAAPPAAALTTGLTTGLTTAVPPSGVDVDLEQVQPTALVPGSDLVVRVRVTNARTTPLDGARVRLFVNSPVLSDRAQVAAWAAGEGVQGGDRFVGVDGSELPLGADLAPGASTEMTFSVQADQLRLDDQFGARGITVDVLDASLQRLDALRSFVVWMPQGAPPASAGLTVLAPVVAGAPDTGTGQLPVDLVEPQVTGDGRLARVVGSVTTPATSLVVDPAVLGPYARAAEDPSGAGTTASPSASTSETPTASASATTADAHSPTATPSTTGTLVAGGEGDAPAAVESWRSRLLALSPGGVAALPRGDTDVAGVVGARTTDLLSLAVAQSAGAATAAAGVPPVAELVWPTAPVAASDLVLAAAAASQDGSAPAVVVDAAAVPGAVSARGTAASAAQLQATGPDGSTSAPVQAVLVDRTDSALLLSATQPPADGSGADPAEVSARLVADTAVAASAGAGGQEQGLVLALPRTWDPDPVAASTVLGPLTSAPWVRSQPLGDLLSAGTAGSPVTVGADATPAAAEVSAVLPADGLQTAQSALDQVRRAGTLVDDPTVLEEPVEVSAVAAASAAWVDQPDAWRTQLSALAQRRAQLGGAVAVVSGSPLVVVNKVVSLPVTVRNDLPQNARVWVSVTSTSLRLRPGAAQEIVVPAGSTQVAYLPVRAVSSGELTLYAVLTDRAGQTVGSPQRLDVTVNADWESRGIAIAVVVVVLVFVGGVVRTVVRVRRRPAPPVVRTAEEADGDGPPTRRPEESTRG